MQIGVINGLVTDREDAIFERVRGFGLDMCQLSSWQPEIWDDALAEKVVRQSEATGVTASSLWAGLPGLRRWNFTEGPITLGLVPAAYRYARIEALKKGARFAEKIGVPAIVTHCGFIPENMTDPVFGDVVVAIREVAAYCAERGLEFWFETGQETPVVLLRVIERVGTGNLGINLDPANLLMYGKGNPIDALDVFGKYVRSIHVKDGECPTDGENLGREVQVGEGKVRFPEFMKRLIEIGFDGPLVIEREIREGEQLNRDIRETVENLERWMKG